MRPGAGELNTRAGETVLVVEDNAAVRAAAVAMLEALGYGVIAAENGPSAISVLESDHACDLLFTSGYSRDALPELGREVHVVRKPYSLKELSEAVRQTLDS